MYRELQEMVKTQYFPYTAGVFHGGLVQSTNPYPVFADIESFDSPDSGTVCHRKEGK